MPRRAWYPSPEELGPRLLKKSAVQAAIAAGGVGHRVVGHRGRWGIGVRPILGHRGLGHRGLWGIVGHRGASGSDRFRIFS